MNTLIAVAIAPCGTGDEFAPYVAEIVRIIRESGLPNRTNSMFKKATQYLTDQGLRAEVVLKADIRPGYTNMMNNKTKAVEDILKK